VAIRTNIHLILQNAIKILPPSINADTLELHFDATNSVLFLHAIDINGKKLKVIKNNNSTFTIYKSKLVYKINYTIKCNWDDEDYALIDLQKHIGYFAAKQEFDYHIKFINKKNWQGVSALTTPVNDGLYQYWKFENYKKMVQEPLLFCKPNSVQKTINQQKFLISIPSKNTNITANDVSELIQKYQTDASDKKTIDSQQTHLIFIPTDNVQKYETVLINNRYEIYKISPIYVSKSIDSWVNDRSKIELEKILNSAINTRNEPSLEWLKQGVVQYLKFKTELMSQPNKEAFFSAWLKQQLLSSLLYADSIPLSQYAKRQPKEELVNSVRGALLMLCFDIATANASNNTRNFNDFIDYFKTKYDGRATNTYDVFYDIVKATRNVGLADMLWRSVDGSAKINWSEWVQPLGYTIETNGSQSLVGIGNFSYTTALQDNGKTAIIVRRADNDYLSNLVGLKAGDVIESVNNKPISTANFFIVLYQITQLDLNVKIPIVVSRNINGRAFTSTLSASSSYFKPKYEIKIIQPKAPSEKQLAMRNFLFGF
jgi:hypothetical protein